MSTHWTRMTVDHFCHHVLIQIVFSNIDKINLFRQINLVWLYKYNLINCYTPSHYSISVHLFLNCVFSSLSSHFKWSFPLFYSNVWHTGINFWLFYIWPFICQHLLNNLPCSLIEASFLLLLQPYGELLTTDIWVTKAR